MKIGGLYCLFHTCEVTSNSLWRPVFRTARPAINMPYDGPSIEDEEVGEIKNDEPFVLLDYKIFRGKIKENDLVTMKILTKDSIIGWIDVEVCMVQLYEQISTR